MASRDQQWYMDTGATSSLLSHTDPNWKQAMCDEYKALIDNNTWIIVPRPPNVNIVCSMWLYQHKYNADGSLNWYKARLVANGRSQQQGIDYDEIFSHVVKPVTIRTVLSLAVSREWTIHQLDVKNAFLHGHLTKIIYMHQPPVFTDSAHSDYVCLLQESLYGVNKADSSLFIFHKGPGTAYYYMWMISFLQLLLLHSCNDTLSRSSVEAEYRGVANVIAETSWIRNLPRELHTPLFTATLVYCDNVSAVYMSANPVQHQRTKHIEIDIYFVRDKVAAGHVRVLHIPSRFRYARRSFGNHGESADNGNVQKDTRNGNVQRILRNLATSENASNVQYCNAQDRDSKNGPNYDSEFISERLMMETLNTNAHDQQDNEMELLAKNAYNEAGKQQIIAKKVNQRNVELAKELEKYKKKDATKSQLKMKGKLEDPIVIEKKVNFVPVNYGIMNDLYETFVPQVELSLEQKYFSKDSMSNGTSVNTNVSSSSSPPLKMLKPSKMLKYFRNLKKEINELHTLLDAKTALQRVEFVDLEDSTLSNFCYNKVEPILDYLHAIFKVIQKEFLEDVQVMMNVFESMESELDETLKQNELLKDSLLEVTLTHDVEKCVLMHSESKNDYLNV
nr:ribonuclease H-like domain-containing protein [Tanacetum cinerariifolium]